MILHTRRYGEEHETHIVIIHGLFGSGDNWHGVAQELSNEYSVLLPDLPNHGDSPHTEEMRYPAIVEALGATLDAHGVERAVFMGHSMGGKAAMKFALDHPERVEGLVVVDIAPRRYPGYHRDIISTMRSVPVESLSARNQADGYLAEGIENRGVRAFLMKNLVRSEDGEGYAWRLNLPVIEAQYDELSSWPGGANVYHGPVLFIAGGTSPYMADFSVDQVTSLFPAAELQTIEGAGHWVHAEARDRFLTRVTEFLHHKVEPEGGA